MNPRSSVPQPRVPQRFAWIAAALAILGALAFFTIAQEVVKGDTVRLDELLVLRRPWATDGHILAAMRPHGQRVTLGRCALGAPDPRFLALRPAAIA